MTQINFRKLKSQIRPLKPEAGGTGFIFIATDEQKKRGIESVSMYGSNRSLIRAIVFIVKHDNDWQKEFTLK